eukprot:PhF_6_TR35376/c0_g1_i3/m.51393
MSDDPAVPLTLCIDMGSHSTRVGWGGDDQPSLTFRTRVSVHDSDAVNRDCVYIGRACDYVSGKPRWKTYEPLNWGGIVHNWDVYNEVLQYAISEAHGNDDDDITAKPLIMTERLMGPKTNREKQTQIAFEDIGVPIYYVGNAQTMGMYASGRTTGTVLDIGYTSVTTVPIYEGYALPHAWLCNDLGGRDIDNVVAKQRGLTGPEMVTTEWKANNLTVLLAGDDTSNTNDINPTEILFKPQLVVSSTQGCAEQLWNTIRKTDLDARLDFYRNLVLLGGCVNLNGFKDRLSYELGQLAPKTYSPLKISCTSDATNSSWRGLSILSSLSSFQSMWITREEYEESGPGIVHR